MKGTSIRALSLVVLMIPVPVATAAAQGTQSFSPGGKVQETLPQGQALNKTDTIKVKLAWNGPGNPPKDCSSLPEITADPPSNNGFSFTIPAATSACAGQFKVTATQQAAGSSQTTDLKNLSIQEIQVGQTGTGSGQPGSTNATPAAQAEERPKITGISPPALFRDDLAPVVVSGVEGKFKGYTLVMFSPGSLKSDGSYSLRIKDSVLPRCGQDLSDAKVPPQSGKNCFQLYNDNSLSEGEIGFQLVDGSGDNPTTAEKDILEKLSGSQSLSLVHNGVESTSQSIHFVNASRTTPRDAALGVAAALVLLIYLLLSAGKKALAANTDERTFLLTALFLDEETKTYSLSKCQFYAWTLAAIAGYVFLAVARSVVQGSAVFPEIPEGLPGILMVSVGTGVLSAAITNSKGAKGAGEVHPTLADFITSGGVIAPDRLQFVVWTVVGIFVFLTIVFKSNLLTVQNLPPIPPGFLQLMGISSAGYLAGKLARKPGPVIKNLSVANVTLPPDSQNLPSQFAQPSGVVLVRPILTLNVKGENLAPNALVKVDGQPLRGDMYWITSPPPDPQSGFCNELNVSLNNAATYLEGKHTLTVVNLDAQAADVLFPIDPMTIVNVDLPDPAKGGQDVTVTGTNFALGDKTTAEWQDESGNPIPLKDAAGKTITPTVTVQSTTQLILDRPPSVTRSSKSKLILTTPIGLKASKTL
jgi:hypothetical protein